MENFLLISNILLWTVVIVLIVFMYLLTKLVVDFLNKFRLSNQTVQKNELGAGQVAPIFRETDRQGNVVVLSENMGKNTYILFTSHTCGICKTIIPQIQTEEMNLGGSRFIIVSDNYDSTIKEPKNVNWIISNGLMKAYFIEMVPTLVTVNQKGTVTSIDAILQYEDIIKVINGVKKAG